MLGIIEVVPNGEHESYSRPIIQHTRSPSEMDADGHWKHIKGGPDWLARTQTGDLTFRLEIQTLNSSYRTRKSI